MKFDTTYQHKNLKTNSNETIPMSNLNLIRQSNDKLHLELFKKLNTKSFFYKYSLTDFSAFSMNLTELNNFEGINVLHSHNYYELIVIIDGELSINLDGTPVNLNTGDACLVNRDTFHVEGHREKEKVTAFLDIAPEVIQQCLQDKEHRFIRNSSALYELFSNDTKVSDTKKNCLIFHPINSDNVGLTSLSEIISQIENELTQKRAGYDYIVNGLYIRILDLFSQPSLYRCDPVIVNVNKGNEIAQLTRQLLDSICKKITYLELGEEMGYNGNYLNRTFIKEYGISIKAYLNLICLRKAAFLLKNSRFSITHITNTLGFNNRTNFNSPFETTYGMMPSAYRQKYQK